jgi:hypothetical protein
MLNSFRDFYEAAASEPDAKLVAAKLKKMTSVIGVEFTGKEFRLDITAGFSQSQKSRARHMAKPWPVFFNAVPDSEEAAQ